MGWLSTQSDKTMEAIKLFSDLFGNIPQKPERMESIRTSLIQSINSEKPEFRYVSSVVQGWRRLGFKEDPRKYEVDVYKNVSFGELMDFYKSSIAGKPVLMTVYGDEKRIKMDELAKYGTILKINKKDLFK
jgi:zinc protease